MDELHGGYVFSKTYLHLSHYQIQMDLTDINKTAFWTHDGHYEFIVMSFGLSNAHSTFQALMNSIFRTYLRHFVLVNFQWYFGLQPWYYHHSSISSCDYSFTFANSYTLFAKISKCVFGALRVEYLATSYLARVFWLIEIRLRWWQIGMCLKWWSNFVNSLAL